MNLRAHFLVAPLAALMLCATSAAEVATGDCDGWTITSTAPPGAGSYYAFATATLYQQVGAEWVVFDAAFDAGFFTDSFTDWSDPNQPPSVLVLGSLWSLEVPQGTYRIEVSATGWGSGTNGDWQVEADAVTTSATLLKAYDREVDSFFCEGPPPPPMAEARTPGFWKNHAEAWQVFELALGDEQELFSQSCLLDLFDTPTKGDVRVILVHHLMAAKLSILSGSDPYALTGFPDATSTVMDTISAADDFIVSAEIGCGGVGGDKPRGATREYITSLKDALDAYNNNFE
ncbi:MAG: hypothetical protein ACJA2W_001049 [Planctomycetota bacterium]|jgi:hypothetical protein